MLIPCTSCGVREGSSACAVARRITSIWYPTVSAMRRTREASPSPTSVKKTGRSTIFGIG